MHGFTCFSLNVLHCSRLLRRESKITLVSSLHMTFFQSSMIQFLCLRQNCSRAFIMTAFKPGFMIDLHDRNPLRFSTRRIVIDETYTSKWCGLGWVSRKKTQSPLIWFFVGFSGLGFELVWVFFWCGPKLSAIYILVFTYKLVRYRSL
jgi:hypothetical protein